MQKLLKISDKSTKFACFEVRNDAICGVLAILQLVVSVASFAQHIYSITKFNNIFCCVFSNVTKNLTEKCHVNEQQHSFLEVDIIIYDFGLFHQLLNVTQCVANHLDGGYMRFLWCTGQMFSLMLLLLVTMMNKPHPYLIYPALLTENCYVLGLTIWTLATLKQFILRLIYSLTVQLLIRMVIYWMGVGTNVFFLFVLWHYFWYVEQEQSTGWVAAVDV